MRGIHNKWEDIMTNDRTGWPMRGLEELDEMYTWLAMLICNSDWIDFESKTKEPLCRDRHRLKHLEYLEVKKILFFCFLIQSKYSFSITIMIHVQAKNDMSWQIVVK